MVIKPGKHDELNKGLRDIEKDHPELRPVNFQDTEKTIPFHGFVFKDVDFDKPIWLGKSPYTTDDGKPINQWFGLCPRPAYGYGRWQVTVEESATIKQLCEQLVEKKTVTQANMLFDYLQMLGEMRDKLAVASQTGI